MHTSNPYSPAAAVERLRQLTPALHRTVSGRTTLFLDAPSGTQMPQPVLDAMTSYLLNGMANRGGVFASSQDTEAMLVRARNQTVALLGGTGYEIIFGQNMTSLAFALAGSIARDWPIGNHKSRIVVSELEHHANIDPWREVARDHRLGVAWLPVDTDRHALNLANLEQLIDENCRLVAVGLSSNAVGTISDVARIAARAREVGAISIVDAVHGLSHIPVDVGAWGADAVLFSAYKIFGPHLGVMAIRRELLDRLRYYKLAPATTIGPGKAEHGTQNMEAVAGWGASVDLIASLGEPHETLRHRLTSAIAAFAQHEDDLTAMLLDGLRSMPGVKLARAPADVPTTSTIAFTVHGRRPIDVATACAQESVYITNGDFYATTLAERTGVAEQGGWVRVGVAAYHDQSDIKRALVAIDKAIRS